MSYEFEKLLAPLRSAWDFIARLVRFVVKNATAIIQLDMIALIVAYALYKAMKSSPLLRPFCVPEFWGFTLLNIYRVCVHLCLKVAPLFSY